MVEPTISLTFLSKNPAKCSLYFYATLTYLAQEWTVSILTVETSVKINKKFYHNLDHVLNQSCLFPKLFSSNDQLYPGDLTQKIANLIFFKVTTVKLRFLKLFKSSVQKKLLWTSSLISPSFQGDATIFQKGILLKQTPHIKN